MAEELQPGIIAGNWWNSPRTPCSAVVNDFGWANDLVDIKSRCCDESVSVSDSFPSVQKSHIVDSGTGTGNSTGSGAGSVLVNSTLQMMGFGSSDWNQDLLRGNGRIENDNTMLQENMNSNSNISIGSSSYVYPSTLLQSLFESDTPNTQQSFLSDRSMNYSSIDNYGTNNYPSDQQFSPSWSKFSPFQVKSSSPKQQTSSLSFSNNTTFWNASSVAGNDVRSNLSSSASQFMSPTFEAKSIYPNLNTKVNTEEIRNSGLVMKKGSEPTFKRPRIETPSPLPTFKVRKEKLGDRITALQQLVSPFGKTDTASVLHEAIEYIKFLHDQVNVLSTPYMKNGTPIQHQQVADKLKDSEGVKQDLKSRGLCLVPISSTFPVANETNADFWTPTFGGTFR